jgi:hypothetical protein
MSIIKIFANSNYISVNRDIIKLLGIHEALLLGELCSEYSYHESQNQLTQDQTSDLMKAKFYNEIITLPNGEKRKVLKSISDKSETDIKEMAEYITKITAECAEWGIDIPFCDNDYNF